MHAFLFTHVHWLWTPLHWVRHGIYAPWAFAVVVFIGSAQTIIAWESGELAVKALPIGTLSDKDQKRYLRLVRFLAVLLFPATFFVGVVNDRSLRDSDDKAQKIQDKLDAADTRAKQFGESFDAFVKTLDPTKLTVTQYAKLTVVQRDAARAAVPAQVTTGSGTTEVHQDAQSPLTKMSNADLKKAATAFAHQLQVDDVNMTNLNGTAAGYRQELYQPGRRPRSPAEGANPQRNTLTKTEEATKALNDYMSQIVARDVPLVTVYRAELLKRLGYPHVTELPFVQPSVPTLDFFLGNASTQIEELANRLP